MEKPGSKPTDEIIRLAIIGDGAAFTRLWDTNIGTLRSYLRSKMKGLDDFYIDDICSRTFEKAFRQIRTYDPSKSLFITWLLKIARNTALDTIEQENRARRQYVSLDDVSRSAASLVGHIQYEGDSALESMIQGEDDDLSRKYVQKLPERYRKIAEMRLVEGMQYKEIAEELNMELNTVRTRIRRAKALIEKAKQKSED